MRARKGDDSGVLSISLNHFCPLKVNSFFPEKILGLVYVVPCNSKTENPGQGFRINFPNSLSSLQELEGLETYQLLFPFS